MHPKQMLTAPLPPPRAIRGGGSDFSKRCVLIVQGTLRSIRYRGMLVLYCHIYIYVAPNRREKRQRNDRERNNGVGMSRNPGVRSVIWFYVPVLPTFYYYYDVLSQFIHWF